MTGLLCGFVACRQSSSNLPGERVRDFANVLYNRDLYKPAIAEYEQAIVLAPARSRLVIALA